jgi:hypothetical protein
MPCTDKNVLGSDYETPLDAVQGGGRLEFTCLPPERDTMSTAWVVSSAFWSSLPCTITPHSALKHADVPNMKGMICLSTLGSRFILQ